MCRYIDMDMDDQSYIREWKRNTRPPSLGADGGGFTADADLVIPEIDHFERRLQVRAPFPTPCCHLPTPCRPPPDRAGRDNLSYAFRSLGARSPTAAKHIATRADSETTPSNRPRVDSLQP